jgi:hypothetical protein
MNDREYLIGQLDLLVAFLEVSDKHIYSQIKDHDRYGLGITIEQLYDNSYENYSSHISTSAFLLGFTYLEDFITKCIVKYLIDNPDKNDCKVSFKTIKDQGADLVKYIAMEQSKFLVFSAKLKFIEKNVKGITASLIAEIRLANDIRNCLMHNNGIADNRINTKYKLGERIILVSNQVHAFGHSARQFSKELWDQTNPISHSTTK